MDKISIFWFRRDLRLHDNKALFHALQSEEKILPIFIFDIDILKKIPKDDARISFIYSELKAMNTHLESFGTEIRMFHGNPKEVFRSLMKNYTIVKVFTNHDYEPYAIKRDLDIKKLVSSNKIDFQTYKDQVIFERNEITKKDGKPYVVYTHYSRKWLEKYETDKPENYPSEDLLDRLYKKTKSETLTLSDIGFIETNIPIKNYIFNSRIINEYEETSNFPALDNTSKLGPHLRFGTVSVRQMVSRADAHENKIFLK